MLRAFNYLFIGLIHFYKLFIFPAFVYFNFGGGCKYSPTCSEYALQCFREKSFIEAFVLSFKRILSCR